MTQTHHGIRAEIMAYSQVPILSEVILGAMAWLPAFVLGLLIAVCVAVTVETMGMWHVNESVMAVRLFLIGGPIWVALYGLVGTIYRKGKWIIEVDHEHVEVQWRRLGRGSTWKIPLRAIDAATLTGSPLRLALHFRDGKVMLLNAEAHFRGHLKPLMQAIEDAVATVRDRTPVPMPDPPRALMAMMSKREAN